MEFEIPEFIRSLMNFFARIGLISVLFGFLLLIVFVILSLDKIVKLILVLTGGFIHSARLLINNHQNVRNTINQLMEEEVDMPTLFDFLAKVTAVRIGILTAIFILIETVGIMVSVISNYQGGG